MNGLESLVLTYVLNSLWQVPLIAASGWFAARLARPIGPAAEHRVWVGALLADALLPGLSLLPKECLFNRTWIELQARARFILVMASSISCVLLKPTVAQSTPAFWKANLIALTRSSWLCSN
jgi:hypothetical protein